MTTKKTTPSVQIGIQPIKDGPIDVYVEGKWIGSRRTIKQVRETLKNWRKSHGIPGKNGNSH